MVTRKPVDSRYSAPSTKPPQPPYPRNPDLDDRQYLSQSGERPTLDTNDGWEDVGKDSGHQSHSLLRINEAGYGEQQIQVDGEVPALLQVGHPEGTPRSSFESRSSEELFPESHGLQRDYDHDHKSDVNYSTNPYHRARSADRALHDVSQSQEESSVDIWAELASAPPEPTSAPPPPPIEHELGGFGALSLKEHDSSKNTAESEPWSHQEAGTYQENPLISFEGAGQYQENIAGRRSPFQENYVPLQSNQTEWLEHQGHSPEAEYQDKTETEDARFKQSGNPSIARHSSTTEKGLPPLPRRALDGSAPDLPPRRSQEGVPPIQPPRPSLSGVSGELGEGQGVPHDPDKSQAKASKQRSETYHIKHITWLDSSGNTRSSPIMIQNANGPCPLLALVNALTLSTAPGANTALLETLRVREQVSLGLLLDAVFDELMSGRRGDAAQELPDVGELYSFLITLHTGMNVNPRFISENDNTPNLIDLSGTEAPSSMAGYQTAGGFEETKEMKLYSTFSIPLIHGWLPPRSHPAYKAFERSARTYEDAQNLMFREEELEDKLQHQGISQDEQILLEDISSIKYFLSSFATQLTGCGLDSIARALSPGSVAILFRNDHFSTLYKHPRSGQLLNLVTDMGYAGHEEVVWESLVDTSGEGCVFFAGDFRPVGNNAENTQIISSNSASTSAEPWTTVSRPNRISKSQKLPKPQASVSTSSNPQRLPTPPHDQDYNLPTSPNTEQEDHDLALALQLQEEEEDRSRRDTAARRREDELSQAYLHSQGSANQRQPAARSPNQILRPMVPPRAGGHAVSNISRPPQRVMPQRTASQRVDPEAGEDAPPPSYEQAAKSQPYVPPDDQPFPPTTSPVFAAPGTRPRFSPQGYRPRQSSAYSQHAASVRNLTSDPRRNAAGRPSPGLVGRAGFVDGLEGTPAISRRRSSGMGRSRWDEDVERQDKDCVVM
ncbi:hypothetical protein MMC13_006953 [Lambiella insularis]|nr:hypothetical protein [Lambiella insularis]